MLIPLYYLIFVDIERIKKERVDVPLSVSTLCRACEDLNHRSGKGHDGRQTCEDHAYQDYFNPFSYVLF